MNAGPPFAAPVQASWLTNRRAFILAFAITAATFVIDIYTPRGLAISVFPYVLTVALSAGMRARAARLAGLPFVRCSSWAVST